MVIAECLSGRLAVRVLGWQCDVKMAKKIVIRARKKRARRQA